MTERLQNILNEIDNGRKEIPLDSVEDKIANDAELAYLLSENNSIMLFDYLYDHKIDEKTLFSSINGTRVIDYIIDDDLYNNILNSIINSITDNIEIVDLLCQSNKQLWLEDLNPEIINKLIIKDNSGTYPIEKYLNDDKALKYMIPLINDYNKLLEICSKYNDYSLMQYVNANVLMNKYNQNDTILEFLVNKKNIIPDVLSKIPDNIDFVNFLMENNYYDYLNKASEKVLSLEVSPPKTLLEILIDKGYNPNISNISEKETVNILYRSNKLSLIENLHINSDILLESASKVFQDDTNKEETILEYLIDNNYNIKESISYSNDKDIIKIL